MEQKENLEQHLFLCRVQTDRDTDYYLKVESGAKELKEHSMNEQFKQRFEQELEKIAESLTKKSGVKQLDKVHERIGRAKQKYPSIARYFDIEVESKAESEVKGKGQGKDQNKAENTANMTVKTTRKQIAVVIKWSVKPDEEINARSGVYFLRTTLETKNEELLWQSYNVIREIEATFRVLKTDLDLRPIYHKKDENTMAHLHLGLLAYWVVNTVRFQLKKSGINSCWHEIVRTMNTQKAVTTLAQNHVEEVIKIRRCSEPNPKVKKRYDALKYKYAPFKKKKSVVHKSELEDVQTIEQHEFWFD